MNMGKILVKGEKIVSVPTLAYRDVQNNDGSTYRVFFSTEVTWEVWSQEEFKGDTLTVFQSNHKGIGNFIRVYLNHEIGDSDLGSSSQELDFHTSNTGLTCKHSKLVEITQEEFTEKWNTGLYRFMKLDGGVLVQPPIAEYSMQV